MRFKIKKCFKWIFISVGLLAVFAWIISHGEKEDGFRQEGGNHHGFDSGNLVMQHSDLHHQMHHGGFHLIGLLLSVFVCGIFILAVITFIRKANAKRGYKLKLTEPALFNDYSQAQQTTSANGQFLDDWEKNLTNLKEDNLHGNL